MSWPERLRHRHRIHRRRRIPKVRAQISEQRSGIRGFQPAKLQHLRGIPAHRHCRRSLPPDHPSRQLRRISEHHGRCRQARIHSRDSHAPQLMAGHAVAVENALTCRGSLSARRLRARVRCGCVRCFRRAASHSPRQKQHRKYVSRHHVLNRIKCLRSAAQPYACTFFRASPVSLLRL